MSSANRAFAFLALGFLLLAAFPADASGRRERDSGHRAQAPGHPRTAGETGIPEIAAIDLAAGEKLSVVASTSIVGDVIAHVGGESIDLTVLIGRGQDPHSYEPTPRALRAVEDGHLCKPAPIGG